MEIEQPAYVIHSSPYRETSALVTCFTPGHGKIKGVVRGVRGSGKAAFQKAASVQPFQKLNLSWREKPNSSSDLISIRQFESLPVRFPLQGDSNVCGIYLNELMYRLLYPNLATDNLFEVYQQSLYELLAAQQRNQQAWILRQFEASLLAEMGHPLLCELDVNQQKILADLDYFYYPNYGAILASLDKAKSGVEIKGRCLLSMADAEYREECLVSLKRLFRVLLAEYLGNKPIKSRELFQ